jgi:excisionase family DNA binding protein
MSDIKPATLRVPEGVRDYSGIGILTIRRAVRSGELPTLKVGKARLARIETVDLWLRSKERAGIAPADAAIAKRTRVTKRRAK